MSALFDFRSFLTVVLLTICTCTYVKMRAPQLMVRLVRAPCALGMVKRTLTASWHCAGSVPHRLSRRSVEVCPVWSLSNSYFHRTFLSG